jgi:hypothetical protein
MTGFDSSGRSLRLPKEFDWSTEWLPSPKILPNGNVLVEEISLIAEGIEVPERVVFLKLKGRSAFIVDEFNGTTTLDNEGVFVKGDVVTVKTEDQPLALGRYPSQFLLERDTTWKCTKSGVRRVKSIKKQLPLRAVDGAIFNAWHALKPTKLQRQILKFAPRNEEVLLEKWSESHPSKGVVSIQLNDEVDFKLSRSASGFKVVAVSHHRR